MSCRSGKTPAHPVRASWSATSRQTRLGPRCVLGGTLNRCLRLTTHGCRRRIRTRLGPLKRFQCVSENSLTAKRNAGRPRRHNRFPRTRARLFLDPHDRCSLSSGCGPAVVALGGVSAIHVFWRSALHGRAQPGDMRPRPVDRRPAATRPARHHVCGRRALPVGAYSPVCRAIGSIESTTRISQKTPRPAALRTSPTWLPRKCEHGEIATPSPPRRRGGQGSCFT
jgi:hypothetical protein